ncbi:CZB domain-containing protein [Erythrobacter sp. SCSIO 43205]|uniref:CZB domain-containing protein n=1 Tax=Erythrobacter sp. SCSIO 43205 TaxID=2779361 RepID=UPI001CA9ABE7|nr:CZB domain-containing protein [Erythrobacter sp. SCSIO 43205]UAB78260.1 CZB domain-containing protein [Erythrobacter sp. SCSIO 43205]
MEANDLIEQIDAAIGAHGSWKVRLRSAIASGSSDANPYAVSCDDQCAFGKWLYDDKLPPAVKAGIPYSVIKRLHADFHRTAGRVLREALDGNTQSAQTVFEGEFADKSATLVRALLKWKRELS